VDAGDETLHTDFDSPDLRLGDEIRIRLVEADQSNPLPTHYRPAERRDPRDPA
jgi:hypothetical protein